MKAKEYILRQQGSLNLRKTPAFKLEKFMNKMEKLLFVTIVCLPLYVLRFKIFGLPSTFLELLIVLTIIIWIYNHLRKQVGLRSIYSAFKSKLLLPSLLFLLTSLVAVFISTDKFAALGIYRAYFLEPWLLFVISRDVFREKEGKILQALIFSGWVISLPALLQLITGKAYFPEASHELNLSRIASFYNSANSVALYLGPLVALLLLTSLTKKLRINSVLAFFSTVTFLIIILLTKSGGALLALGIVAAFYLLFNFSKSAFMEKLLGLFPLVIVSSALVFFLFLINISLFTPKTGLVYPRPFDSTRIIRLCLWEGTEHLLRNNIFWGTGVDNFPRVYKNYRTCDTELFVYPHNIFLNFWTETGLLGLISFLFLVFNFHQIILKSKLETGVKVALTAYLVYFFVHGLVDVPYFKNDLSAQFWVYLALGMSLAERNTVSLGGD